MATHLYYKLGSAREHPSKKASGFTHTSKREGLKQKIMFASADDGTVVQYKESVIRRTFLTVVRPDIRTELGINDEDILQRLSEGTSIENERQQKLWSKRSSKNVCSARGSCGEVRGS